MERALSQLQYKPAAITEPRCSYYLACVASDSVGFFRPFEEFFAFWRRINWGERKKWKEVGSGRGGEKRKRLPANPMIFKNAPCTLSQLVNSSRDSL